LGIAGGDECRSQQPNYKKGNMDDTVITQGLGGSAPPHEPEVFHPAVAAPTEAEKPKAKQKKKAKKAVKRKRR